MILPLLFEVIKLGLRSTTITVQGYDFLTKNYNTNTLNTQHIGWLFNWLKIIVYEMVVVAEYEYIIWVYTVLKSALENNLTDF